uniref:Uncharacterized protein n=1 Tax=Daphnia magna TaxID=35525 RepID=A0A0P6C7F2_9CRUS
MRLLQLSVGGCVLRSDLFTRGCNKSASFPNMIKLPRHLSHEGNRLLRLYRSCEFGVEVSYATGPLVLNSLNQAI